MTHTHTFKHMCYVEKSAFVVLLYAGILSLEFKRLINLNEPNNTKLCFHSFVLSRKNVATI